VELHEVSVVQSWPAYSQTEVSLRSKPAAQGFVDLDDHRHAQWWLETCR
jgi:phage head maturation protease